MAAMSLRRSQTYEGERHRSRCLRLDTQRAIKATAHRLAKVIYSMVTYGHEYNDPGLKKKSKRNGAPIKSDGCAALPSHWASKWSARRRQPGSNRYSF